MPVLTETPKQDFVLEEEEWQQIARIVDQDERVDNPFKRATWL